MFFDSNFVASNEAIYGDSTPDKLHHRACIFTRVTVRKDGCICQTHPLWISQHVQVESTFWNLREAAKRRFPQQLAPLPSRHCYQFERKRRSNFANQRSISTPRFQDLSRVSALWSSIKNLNAERTFFSRMRNQLTFHDQCSCNMVLRWRTGRVEDASLATERNLFLLLRNSSKRSRYSSERNVFGSTLKQVRRISLIISVRNSEIVFAFNWIICFV